MGRMHFWTESSVDNEDCDDYSSNNELQKRKNLLCKISTQYARYLYSLTDYHVQIPNGDEIYDSENVNYFGV